MSLTVIRETLRRHFAHVVYVACLIVFVVIAAVTGVAGGSSGATFGIFTLFTIIAGCQLIGPEFSSGTLQLILSKPIRRSSYLLSRIAGVTLALWIVLLLAGAADVLGRLGAGNSVSWTTSSAAVTAAAAQALLVCALMALFGSFTRSYLNVAFYLGGQVTLSMLMSLLLIVQRSSKGVVSSLGAFIRDHPGMVDSIRRIDENLYPDPPMIPFDRNWLLLVVGNAAIAALVACLIFRRREVPYGAD